MTPDMNALSLMLSVLIAQAGPAAAPPPRLNVTLLPAQTAVAAGGHIDLAVQIDVPKPWHMYHPIILDTGLPTTVDLDAPDGVTFGDLRFPRPEYGATETEDLKIEYLALDGRFYVLTTLAVDDSFQPGSKIEIKAEVSGLACIVKCVLVDASASLALPVAQQSEAVNGDAFKKAREALPPALGKAPYIEGSAIQVKPDRVGIDEPAEIIATIRIKKNHHIQARDPGVDALIPTRLFIEPRNGVKFAKEGQWKWPEAHERDVQYIGRVRDYSGEVEIRVPFRITDTKFPSGPVELRALLQYQCCTDAGQCYPPEMVAATVRFTADTPNPPAAAPAASGAREANAAARSSEPVAQEGGAETSSSGEPSGANEQTSRVFPPIPELAPEDWADSIPWQPWRAGWAEELSRRGHRVYVDYTATWCLTCQTNKKLVLETNEIRQKMRDLGVIPIKADFTNRSDVMFAEIKQHGHNTVPLNLVYAPGEPDRPGVLPAVLTKEIVKAALDNPFKYANGGPPKSLLLVLIGGFVGGLILNVMPCVLPVISIKILSFVQQAGEDPKRVLRLGLAFCAGIMVWFWLFAAFSATGNIPWQYPAVVIGLSSLIFVFALNLFGVFEITLPGASATQLDTLTSREGYSGAFFKGLLATLLGTACTAPFLAGALGYALTQPASVGLAIFTSAGVGMALPYLILSAKPAWLKYVPKPGPWMVTFKQAAGFVLLATAVWLLWILASQLDAHGVVWTVAFWGFLALAVWMLGRIRPTWETRSRMAMWGASAAVAMIGLYFCFFYMYDWRGREEPTTAPTAAQLPLSEPAHQQFTRKDHP